MRDEHRSSVETLDSVCAHAQEVHEKVQPGDVPDAVWPESSSDPDKTRRAR